MFDDDDDHSVLMNDGILYLSGIVHPSLISEAAVNAALRKVSGPLVVALNSGGGDAQEGVAIYNTLRRWCERPGNELLIEVDGIAASAASMIFMAGDVRTVREGALVMVHEPWGFAIGAAEDMRKSAEVLDKHSEAYARVYAARTGRSEEDIRQLMADETWMSSEDARELGFATDVVKDPASDPQAYAYGVYRHPPEACLARSVSEQQLQSMISKKGYMMPDQMKPAVLAASPKAAAVDVASPEQPRTDDARDAILALCERSGLSVAEARAMLAENLSLEQAKDRVIDVMASRNAPVTDDYATLPARSTMVDVEASEKFSAAVVEGQLARYGVAKAKHNEFSGYRLSDVARACLEQRGIRPEASIDRLWKQVERSVRADAGIRHNTGDFPKVLENIAQKAVLNSYDEAPQTYRAWCRIGTLTDFRIAGRASLNPFPNLAEIPESGEITLGTVSESGETIRLRSFARRVGVTRQALINDDLGEFIRIATSAGGAAARTEGDLAYAVLTANANMSDGVALFAAGRNNLGASGNAGVPSVTTLNYHNGEMAKQKAGDAVLNVRPQVLIVPRALEATALQLRNSTNDPSQGDKRTLAANPFANTFEVVSDARLDAASATAWYVAHNPSEYAAVEVAFLAGQPTPIVDTMDGWSVDGVEFRVRHYVTAAAIDARPIAKNNGA